MSDMISEDLSTYLAELRKERLPKLDQMVEVARAERIPIMQPETMGTVEMLIRLHTPKKILEIGAAIGYSAINMALAAGETGHVVTLERDPNMADQARQNFQHVQLKDRITLIETDALEPPADLASYGPFDLIFIDAGKGHYQTFFNAYTPLLNEEGIVLCDNVLFRGYVMEPDLAPKRVQKLAKKMRAFNQWLHDLEGYETILLPVGDGLSVTHKNQQKFS